VSGYTGCNETTGSFTVGPADRLKLQQLASTRRACIGPNVEDALLRALQQVSRYAVKGNELLLLPEAGDQPLARFRLAATPSPRS
jgi:heat shock protein HslJ